MTWLVWVTLGAPASARDIQIEVPFPTAPIFDGDTQRVCLGVNVELGIDHTESEANGFLVSCEPKEGGTQACLQVLEPREWWPRRVPPLICEGTRAKLVMQPVPTFDPTEPWWDGVTIARNVDLVRAVFRAEGEPDAVGVLDPDGYGSCGIKDETLWIVVPPEPKRQTCTLDTATGPAVVPITLVKRLDQGPKPKRR